MKKITTIPLQSKSKNEIEIVIIYVHGYSFGVKIKPVSMEWFSVSKRTNLKSLKNNVEYIYITKLRCCIYDFIMCYDSDCIWIQLYFIQKCDVNHFVSCMCTTFFLTTHINTDGALKSYQPPVFIISKHTHHNWQNVFFS